MPFKKVGPNKYRTPSGKTMTRKQVRAYQATNGFNKPFKRYKSKKGKSC